MEENINEDTSMDENQQSASTEAQLQRALADYANLKKRFEKEKEDIVKFSNEVLLMQMLGVVDGFEMTMREMQNLLERSGFKKVEVNVGDKFDPNTMEAIERGGEGEEVAFVYAHAYSLHDKVVRPAKVKVGKNKEENNG